MPDQFEFLSLDAFKKLTTDERQAYLERVARYVGALKADLDDYGKTEERDEPRVKRHMGRTL